MGLYVFGFILWNIDNAFCLNLREFRRSQPLLGHVTQLHSWWHIFAGLGTYLHIVLSSRVRMEYLQNKTRIDVRMMMHTFYNLRVMLLCACVCVL
jgi:dihydroceramidase